MTSVRSVSLLLIAVGCTSLLLYAYMSVVSHTYADATFVQAALVYGGATLMCAVGALGLSRNRRLLGCADTRRQIVLIVFGFGVLFRLLGFFTFPVLEDDFYRYLWDGWMFVDTGSPYSTAPSVYFANETLAERFETILSRINYPDLATVYGPSLQLVFGLSYLIAPGELWPLKCLFTLADVAVILLLLRLIQPKRPQQLICWMLYAWSPLLIKEFATTAHPDVLGVLFVLLAFSRIGRASGRTGLFLAFAVGVKPFALIFAPFLVGLRRRAQLGFVVGLLLLTWPFLQGAQLDLIGSTAFAVWIPEGLRAMSSGWSFNAGLYLLADVFRRWFPLIDVVWVFRLTLAVFAVLWFLQLCSALRTRRDTSEQLSQKFVILFGLFLLILPALNPWYLVWWLPFAVISPYVTPWVASVAVLMSYASGINVPNGSASPGTLYTMSDWALVLEYGLIALALSIDLYRARA